MATQVVSLPPPAFNLDPTFGIESYGWWSALGNEPSNPIDDALSSRSGNRLSQLTGAPGTPVIGFRYDLSEKAEGFATVFTLTDTAGSVSSGVVSGDNPYALTSAVRRFIRAAALARRSVTLTISDGAGISARKGSQEYTAVRKGAVEYNAVYKGSQEYAG